MTLIILLIFSYTLIYKLILVRPPLANFKYRDHLFLLLNFVFYYYFYMSIDLIYKDYILEPKSMGFFSGRVRPLASIAYAILFVVSLRLMTLHKIFYYFIILGTVTLYLIYSKISLFFIGEGFLLIRLLLCAKQRSVQKEFRATDYLNFVFYFPLVLCGPLLSLSSFTHQVLRKKCISSYVFSKSLYLLTIGVFKLIIISPSLFAVYSHYSNYLASTTSLKHLILSGAGFYTSLYFSFSGLCDLATAFSVVLGIHIPRNFKNPLMSMNLQEHWLRWHVSFMNILRETIYIPSVVFLHRNQPVLAKMFAPVIGIFIVFISIGIWQGGNLRYVEFALWHAMGLTIVFYYGKFNIRKTINSKSIYLGRTYDFLSWIVTIIFISLGYFIFMNDLDIQFKILQKFTL